MALTESNSAPPNRKGRAAEEGWEGESPTRRWWPVLLPLALVVIVASVYFPYGRHQWALSLIRQPTPYTVLAFNKAASLPTQTVIGRPVTVSFAIGNQEGRPEDYRYVLTQDASTQGTSQAATMLGQATRNVAAGATWDVTTAVHPLCQSSPCRIQVSLPGHPEKIDFLVNLRTSDQSGPRG